MKQKGKNKFPRSWNEARIRRVLEYYENQTDEDAAAEIAGLGRKGTMMHVPRALVPVVRRLIAKHAKSTSHGS